jgi:hypothetical protein
LETTVGQQLRADQERRRDTCPSLRDRNALGVVNKRKTQVVSSNLLRALLHQLAKVIAEFIVAPQRHPPILHSLADMIFQVFQGSPTQGAKIRAEHIKSLTSAQFILVGHVVWKEYTENLGWSGLFSEPARQRIRCEPDFIDAATVRQLNCQK